MQRQQHGEQRHWMLVTLACMLGQIGLPGGGFGLSYHYSGGGAPTANGPALPGITDGSAGATLQPWPENGPAPVIPIARFTDMLENPGAEFDFNGRRATYPDVKMVYWVGGNHFCHHQDRNRQVRAWRKVQTFVVHDFQWTATARHSDIVLPCTSSYERNDIETVGDYSGGHILAMKKAVEPVFEARNDYDIFAALAARAGREQAFTEGRSEMAWLRSLYDAARAQARTKRVEMPEFDAFWNGQGYVAFTPTPQAMEFVRHKAFRDDPLLNPLGTPSGRIEIYSRNIERMNYADCPPHPTWMEPSERLGMANQPYPLHVASSHPRSRLHSQLCGTSLRAGYAVAGREPCLINPADAAARGIANGDVVRVFNGRGQILAGAVVTDDIMPGVIRLNEGAWYDPVESGSPNTLCRYGDVNVLTQDIGTSKLAQGTSALTVLADVEKYQGTPPPVGVFEAPAMA
jgi:trimethylamine-N-oxide reductase (cytochrome c)